LYRILGYEFKEATLYTAFKRLEEGGFITSYWGEDNVTARRRYYSITERGKEEYIKLLNDWNKSKNMIEKLIDTEAICPPSLLPPTCVLPS
jgi:PadR family transcriptional regulator PadR